jgi:UDP-glucose 4-epimerase
MALTNIFVTGGAGFIGSHLVDELLRRGHRVTVYDNLSSGKKNFLVQHRDNVNLTMIEGDLLDYKNLVCDMQGHDVVFHLAANPDIRKSITDTYLDLEQGTIATYNVLEAMRVNRVGEIVFSSSSAVYGESRVIAHENTPLHPISMYGASKMACEALIESFCNMFNMRGTILRFANIVGPRATHGVILDFIKKLEKTPTRLEVLGNGKQYKSYLHVDKCVEGMLHCWYNAPRSVLVNIYNLCGWTTSTVSYIAETVVKESGLNGVDIVYESGDRGWNGDVPQMEMDGEKASLVGWYTSESSNEAIRRAIIEILIERRTK